MSTYINIPPTQAGGGGALGFYRARALAFLGLNPLDPMIGEDFDDFPRAASAAAVSAWQPNPSGTGAVLTQVPATSAGIVRATTGATAASQQLITGTVGQVANVSTQKWYQAWRFRIPSTPDAQAKHLVGLFNFANNKTISVGFYGPLNATKFVLQYDGVLTGTVVDLGPAVDTAFHVAELYGIGSTTVRVRFDAAAEVPAVMAAAPADSCQPIWGSLNGTTAAAQFIELDYFYAMFQRI